MKKIILILLFLVGVAYLCNAQIPARWFTSSVTYALNPYAEKPLTSTVPCLAEITWDGDMLKIQACGDNNYQFERTGGVEYDSEKNYYVFTAREPSGDEWTFIFYEIDLSLTLLLKDQSVFIVYENK
jgi:hypothetical protein